jgi:hypothetical protein
MALRDAGMFKTVLWATDGSAAKSIAQTYDATLFVTHVPVVLAGPTVAVNVAQESADATRAALQRTVEELKRDGATTEFALPEMAMHGPAHAIAELARAVDADLISAVGAGRPYLLLMALFVLTAVLGQIVSNTATVLIVAPVAVAAAAATHTSVRPVLMLVAVAGAAALLTPIATPANMMVMNPAGYRFGDYWKLGLPVMLWWLVVSLVVIPLVWKF